MRMPLTAPTSPINGETGSVAARYRPHHFADVVGQRHAKIPLQRAIAAGKLPQQLLFSGGSGLGKTTLARICAAALLCQGSAEDRPAGDCCGVCANCTDIVLGQHPDVIEIDAASNGRVDEIRELAARAHFAPMRGLWRIYIIDEAHGLSAAGGQAFLKLLEEPPSHVIFMLATTDPEKMLHTNRSRCTEFELVPPSREELVANVVRVANAEGVPLDTAVGLEVVNASPAELGLRGTLMSLEKVLPALRAHEPVSIAELLGKPSRAALDELCSALAARDTALAVSRFVTLRARFPVPQLLAAIADLMHDALVDAVVRDAKDVTPYLAAADALVHARRDGSDLAAVAAILRASGLQLRSLPVASATTDSNPVSNVPLPAVSTPPTATTPTTPAPPSITTPTSPILVSDPASVPVSVPVSAPIAPTGGSPKQKNPVESPYAIDPWSSVSTPSPTAPEVSPEAAFGELLGALAAQRTASARLLQASLRGLKVSSAAGILTIECTPPARRIVAAHEHLLHEAAATCSLEVRVLPERGPS